jgi:hypothetical protein
MDFLDEDDPLEPDSPVSSRRAGSSRQRQIVVRRLFGVAVLVGVLILLLLGFKGCLDARKERGFENYVSDLTAVANESQQLSEEFFKKLEDPEGSELQLEAQIAADRGTAEGLLKRLEALDTPDALKDAQGEMQLAFELRRDGISGTAEQIQNASSKEGGDDAVKQIAGFMRYFLASDVLYARAADAMNTELEAEGIGEQVPASVFLPEPNDQWLDEGELGSTLAGVAGASGDIAPGVHGMGLVQTEVSPGGVVLTDGAAATVSGSGPFELLVQAQNQGENEESDVEVTFELSGGSYSSEGSAAIPTIEAGVTEEATLAIEDEPPSGEELELTVSVTPVPGEEVSDNNEATYTVTFG